MSRSLCAAAFVAAALATAPAAAQTPSADAGILGRSAAGTSLTLRGTGSLDGNAFDMRDMAAVAALRQDFRATDALLIGGLLPARETARLASMARNELVLAHHRPGGTAFGIAIGTAAVMGATVPEGVTHSLRSDTDQALVLDPAGTTARGAAFLTAAAAARTPIYRRGPVSLSATGEVRWYHAVAGGDVRITSPAPLEVTGDGVTGDLTVSMSGPGRMSGSGLGFTTSLELAAGRLDAMVALRDAGAVRIRGDLARTWHLHARDVPVDELLSALDTLTPQLRDASTFDVELPTAAVLSATYTVTAAVRAVGALVLPRTGSAFGELGARWAPLPSVALAAGPRLEAAGTGFWLQLESRVQRASLRLGGASGGAVDPAAAHNLRFDGALSLYF